MSLPHVPVCLLPCLVPLAFTRTQPCHKTKQVECKVTYNLFKIRYGKMFSKSALVQLYREAQTAVICAYRCLTCLSFSYLLFARSLSAAIPAVRPGVPDRVAKIGEILALLAAASGAMGSRKWRLLNLMRPDLFSSQNIHGFSAKAFELQTQLVLDSRFAVWRQFF